MESSQDWAEDEKLASEAYARVAPDAATLPVDELVQVNLDLPQAATTILGVLPRLLPLRDRIIKELPTFDITQLDKLEDYALALLFSQSVYQTATAPPDGLAELVEEAVALRERLRADAQALSLHNLVDARKLDALKGTDRIKNVAQDLQILSQLMTTSWPQIQGKSATVLADLETASKLGTRLTRVAGVRERTPGRPAAAKEQRQRVFTLALRAYSEARSAVAYLRRREGDADSITPNLYTGKGSRRRTEKATSDESAVNGSVAPGLGAGSVAPSLSNGSDSARTVAAPTSSLASKDPFLD